MTIISSVITNLVQAFSNYYALTKNRYERKEPFMMMDDDPGHE